MIKYINGGIGDILVSLQDAKEAKEIDLYSHFAGAKEMVENAGVKVNKFVYYTNKIPEDTPGEQLPFRLFPVFDLPYNVVDILDKYDIDDKPIIGVHPFGSNFSRDFWAEKDHPIKNFSNECIEWLIEELSTSYNIFLYGTCSELDQLRQNIGSYFFNKNVHLFCNEIWESLASVALCDAVIAADSCIKTMSAILGKPTYVYLGNYVDHYRDQIFIDPYIREGVMKVWQFTRPTPQMFKPAINDILSN